MTAPRTEFLSLLRSPDSGAGLVADDGVLVDTTPGERKTYPVTNGIPVLLPGSHQLEERESIALSYETRSASYYEDNYERPAQPERRDRRQSIEQLLGALVTPGARVLEAGAGPLVLADSILKLTSEYVAVDLSFDNLRAGRQRIGEAQAVVGDLAALPLHDATFDVVVAVGCLEYVRELDRAIAELTRVTRPGGRVIATFANARSPRRWWDEGLINPLAKTVRSMRGRGAPTYGRHLTTRRHAVDSFTKAGASVERLAYFNPGLLGYPLSGFGRVQAAQDALARRSQRLRTRSSEFLIVVSRNG